MIRIVACTTRKVSRATPRAGPLALFCSALALFVGATPLPAQFARPAGDVAIYLVTAGPGSDPLTWFGHTALVVADGVRQRDAWYDYGIIDDALNPLLNELRGDIRARVIRSSAPLQHLAALERDDRAVLVQELRLSISEREEIIAAMEADVRTYGRTGYAYDHLTANCATRVRDVIDHATHGALSRDARAHIGPLTAREHGDRQLMARSVFMDVTADFMTGRAIDRPMTVWDESYIPVALARAVASDTLKDGSPLGITRYEFVTRHHAVPERESSFAWCMLAVGISLAIIVLTLARVVRTGRTGSRRAARIVLAAMAGSVTLTLGVIGTVIVIAMTLTKYTFLSANENVLLANPLLLAMLPATIAFGRGLPQGDRVLRAGWLACAVLALVAIVTKVLPGHHQDNWREIALVAPVVLACATSFVGQRSVIKRYSPEDSANNAKST